MRFIIREQDYEQLVASGQLVYELDGQPTGTLETWRLTEAVAGYRFLRVDLDAREAASGNSYLYHATLNDKGTAERLKFRVYGDQRQILGDVLFEDSSVTVARQIDDERHVEELSVPSGFAFWFPTAMGLSLLTGPSLEDGMVAAVSLDPDQDFAAVVTNVRRSYREEEELVVTRQVVWVRRCLIGWLDQIRTIWIDKYGLPVVVERDDGLKGIEKRYIRHKTVNDKTEQEGLGR